MGAHVEDCGTYVRVTYHDVWPSAAESLRVRQAAVASGHWHGDGRALFDLRTVQVATAPHYDVASERVDGWVALADDPPRIALLTTRGAAFGVARMLQQIWPGRHMQTFVDETAALAWLHRDPVVAETVVARRPFVPAP